MVEIRGDFKDIHRGVLKKVDFLGCERKITFLLLGLFFFGNLLLMWSWYQLILIVVLFFSWCIGKYLYIKDPEMLSVFLDNLHFESPQNHYLLASSSIKNLNKKYFKG